MHIITLPTLPSTSSYLAQLQPPAPHGTVVVTPCQSAGRGQRGNSWESAPGLNATLSVMLRPRSLHAVDAFLLSEAVSVAVADALDAFLGLGTIKLKWPNDIYVADSKLGGILIENSLRGQYVERSIVGIGVNVNQLEFLSDAPNPVSMAGVAGHTFSVHLVVRSLAEAIVGAPALLARPSALQRRYRSLLWRAQGSHPYIDAATREPFSAAIEEVEPTGHIVLRLPDGSMRRYAFKEVAAVISPH